MFKNISRKEWKWLGIIWTVVTVIVYLPLAIGYVMTPADSYLLFRPTEGGDQMVYFSQIEQVKNGEYLFKDFFTSEPQAIGVFNPLWLFVGILAVIFHLSSFIAFQVAKFLLMPILLLSGYCLISLFFSEKKERMVCFIFFIFASGFAPWLKLFLSLGNVLPFLTNSDLAEDFTFTTLFSPPHFIAATTLIILIFLFSLYFFKERKYRYSFLAGLSALLLFSFHPYHIYTVVFVLLAFITVDCIIQRKVLFDYIKHYIIVMAFSVPPMLYHLWVFSNIPVRYQTMLLNVTLNPYLWVTLVDYSVLLLFATFGALYALQQKPIKKINIFLIVWLVVQFALAYLPINTQRRLFQGLNIPMIILAVQGLFFLSRKWQLKDRFKKLLPSQIPSLPIYTMLRKFFWNVFLVYMFIFLFAISTVAFLIGEINPLLYRDSYLKNSEHVKQTYRNMGYDVDNNCYVDCYPAYISQDDKNAMLWLRGNTPQESVILSKYVNGNIIPVIGYRVVYLGHWAETAQSSMKIDLVEKFFKTYTAEQRKEFLEKNNISYLFWAQEEKKGAKFNPDEDEFLEKVYSNNSVSIYKVN